MKDIELIKELSNANGAPGFEHEVLQKVMSNNTTVFNYEKDSTQNLYLYLKDSYNKDEPSLLLDAHSDEVAFMVQSIKKNGMINVIPLGNIVPNNATAQKMRILSKTGLYVKAIVSSKPIHFMREEEKNKNITVDDLMVDVGASSRDEVINEYQIEVGAPVIPDVEFEYFEEHDIMMGKAFDNRLGCACVVETMKKISSEKLDFNVVGGIAAQEEVGTRGARVTSNRVKPKVAIVFEGTPADDNFKDEDEAQSILKSGPQIRIRDNSMISNPALVSLAKNVAMKLDIPVQLAVRKGGGTNGGEIHLSNLGVPTIVLGVPVRYVHTSNGISTLTDFRKCVELAVGIIMELNNKGLDSLN